MKVKIFSSKTLKGNTIAIHTFLKLQTREPQGDILVFTTVEYEIEDASRKIIKKIGYFRDFASPVLVLFLVINETCHRS